MQTVPQELSLKVLQSKIKTFRSVFKFSTINSLQLCLQWCQFLSFWFVISVCEVSQLIQAVVLL